MSENDSKVRLSIAERVVLGVAMFIPLIIVVLASSWIYDVPIWQIVVGLGAVLFVTALTAFVLSLVRR